MCSVEEGFILCVCDELSEKIDWKLERRDLSKPIEHLRGRTVLPRYSEKEMDIIQFICTDLNKRNCFDFAYVKSEGDVLSIGISDTVEHIKKWFRFRVVGNVWVQDRSSSLDGWRRQMVTDKSGFVQ